MSKTQYVPVVATSDAPPAVDSTTANVAFIVSLLSCAVSLAAIAFIVSSMRWVE
jgi:hypothetical protein